MALVEPVRISPDDGARSARRFITDLWEVFALNAFEDVRILDLSTGIAGPQSATFFADFGADVVKLERPEGDPARRTASFVVWNRGKRGAVADPSRAEDRAAVRSLTADVDLLIVNETTDLIPWGLDLESLLAAPGSPVVLELPAWFGPAPWSGGHESQGLLAAASAYSSRQASYSGAPVDIVYPHLQYIQAVWGAACAAAALTERVSSGRGQRVTVDGLHAVAQCFTGNYTMNPALPDPDSGTGPGGKNPTYTHYQGADGKWFLVAGLTPKFQEMILRAVDESWIIDDPRIEGDLTRLYADTNRVWVKECLEARFRTRTRDDWLTHLKASKVPCSPLNERYEAFAHPQCEAIGIRQPIKDAEYGDLTIVGQPVRASRTPAEITSGAPGLDSSVTDLTWLPRSAPTDRHGAPASARPASLNGPLADMRVLSLGSFVAGPFGAFLLGELGADVIKIEPPAGDPWRDRGFYYSDGMRSAALHLKDEQAHDAFLEIARTADVVIDNLRPGVAKSLGVDYDAISAVNPDVITVSLSGFGIGGPLQNEPGFDPVLQAWSGMSIAQGGDDTPVLYTVPVNDVSGAAIIAFGATMALFHHARTGEGQPVTTSLAAASMYMQCGQLIEGTDNIDTHLGGRDFEGPSEVDRYYRVEDGWVRVQAAEGTPLGEVLTALGCSPDAEPDVAFATLTKERASALLNAAGIAAVPSRTVREIVTDPAFESRFRLHQPSPISSYYRPTRYAAFSCTPRTNIWSPPGVGEQSREILLDVGLTPGAVDSLVERGVVAIGDPLVPEVFNPYR